MKAELKITDTCCDKVYHLLKAEEEDLGLRIYIKGGGCAGFQYGFSFELQGKEDDYVVTHTAETGSCIRVMVDPISYPYLKDAVIDYKEDAKGARFVIDNPNAKTTCGCGSSFSSNDT